MYTRFVPFHRCLLGWLFWLSFTNHLRLWVAWVCQCCINTSSYMSLSSFVCYYCSNIYCIISYNDIVGSCICYSLLLVCNPNFRTYTVRVPCPCKSASSEQVEGQDLRQKSKSLPQKTWRKLWNTHWRQGSRFNNTLNDEEECLLFHIMSKSAQGATFLVTAVFKG